MQRIYTTTGTKKWTEKQIKKKEEYLEKMRNNIVKDLEEGNNYVGIALNIGVSIEFFKQWLIYENLRDIYGEPSKEN